MGLLGSYSLFLLATAAGIDVTARHSHRRSERFRTLAAAVARRLAPWFSRPPFSPSRPRGSEVAAR